jgi:hypothetical protein
MQVTISLLPVSLYLVRIPRSRLSALSHPLLRQILKPNHSFLNITCNELELSVLAEKDLLHDFDPIAKKDRQKLLISRSRPGPRSKSEDYEFVELSYDTWNVLQIDSHSDALGKCFHHFLGFDYFVSRFPKISPALAYMTYLLLSLQLEFLSSIYPHTLVISSS